MRRRTSFVLSFPFAAGVLAGNSLASGLEVVMVERLSLLCLFAVLGFIAALEMCHANAGAFCSGLFAFLGLFCALSRSLSGAPHYVPGGVLVSAMEALRRRIEALPLENERSAPLLEALMTGRKKALDSATVQAFRSAGAAHILALSGLHLGVLSSVLDRLLSVMGRSRVASTLRRIVVLAAALFYTLMCGAGASLVRAFIFICISAVRTLDTGRSSDGVQALLIAIVVQLAIRPDWAGDLAFRLSYLSMCGIFFLYPKLKDWHPAAEARRSLTGRIWKAMALSLSCQAFTAPLVFSVFGTLPVHFLLANLIALPLCELLVSIAAVVLVLPPDSLSCALLCRICDTLAQALEGSMHVIASM